MKLCVFCLNTFVITSRGQADSGQALGRPPAAFDDDKQWAGRLWAEGFSG